MKKRFTFILASLYLHSLASASPNLTPEAKEAFRKASVGEDGYLYPSGSGRELIIKTVKENWKDLLDHLDDVPSEGGTIRSAARVVGNAAEELPPLEYLDFLEHYLTAYSRGQIDDDILRWQLGGVDRKNYFITVNATHPRVRALLLRTKELVSKNNIAFQEYLDEEIAGKRSDMYMANKSDDDLAPETLPGIKLRSPFESLIAKVHRRSKEPDGSNERKFTASKAKGQPINSTTSDWGSGRTDWKTWTLTAALLALLFAVWKFAFKKHAFRKRNY